MQQNAYLLMVLQINILMIIKAQVIKAAEANDYDVEYELKY